MSFLKSKFNGWLVDGTRTPYTGGGSPGPSTTYSQTSNIPEYARPYVENMLQSTQAQIYNDDMTSFRPYTPYSTDVNNYFADFSPLQQSAQQSAYNLQVPGQYGLATGLAGAAGIGSLGAQDHADYLSGQSLGYGQAGQTYGDVGQMYGAQGAQQAQLAAQNAQLQAQRYGQQAVRTGQQSLGYGQQGAQYGQGAVGLGQDVTQLAQQQGLGYGAQGAGYGSAAAGLAPQAQQYGQGAADIGMGGLGYGALGTGYGAQAAGQAQQGYGAGAQFAQQATDPAATRAYMSPYMQNVVDYQKSQALRDYEMAAPYRAAKAVGAGAFGGSRQAIESSEAQRSLMSQLQGIEATGSQDAFKNAQAQQQFGANLGLQGLQAGYQGTGMGIQGAQTGLSGLGTAMQGQQAGLAGLQGAGSLYGQGMQGAGVGLSGLQGALAGSAQGLQGYQTGLQGAQTGMQGVSGALAGYNTGLQGVGQQLGAGQLGLSGTGQGIQGAQAGMQGAQTGLQGVQGAVGAGQYGLAGYGQATQAANVLGTLGGQQLGAEQSIISTQAQQGATQQAQEQAKINQAIQDYATQQQYPMMQLGMMSNMLRGLPMQSQTTQMYQAQPSTLQQGIGLLGAGASLYGAGAGKAGGGHIKEMAEGGIAGYKYGGAIPEAKLTGMADNLSIQQLQQRLADKDLDSGERQIFADALQDKTKDKARYAGIAGAGGGLFNTMGYAGGGILAFADGDLVEEEVNQKPTTIAEQLALQRSLGPKGKFGENTEKDITAREEQAAKRLDRAEKIAMAQGFLEFGGTAAPGGIGQAGIAGVKKYAEGYGKAIDSQEAFKAETAKMNRELENARRAEERGDVKTATESQAKYEDIQARLKAAQISAAASHAAVNLKQEEKNAIKADLTKSLGREPTMAEILSAYAKATSVADESSDARLRVAANTAYQKWEAGIILDPTFRDLQKKAVKGDEAAAAKIEQIKSAKRQQINAEIMGTQTAAAPAPTPSVMSPDKDGNIQVPGKGTFKQLPNGNYVKVG